MNVYAFVSSNERVLFRISNYVVYRQLGKKPVDVSVYFILKNNAYTYESMCRKACEKGILDRFSITTLG
jgi:hypothetical protein